MNFLKKPLAEKEPEAPLDFSDIERYRWSDPDELEPGQELHLHRNLGLTALRLTPRDPASEGLIQIWRHSPEGSKAA